MRVLRLFHKAASFARPPFILQSVAYHKKILSDFHPKSIKVQDLDESIRASFTACRTAIFNSDYQALLPILQSFRQSPAIDVVLLNALVEALGKMNRMAEIKEVVNTWLKFGGKPSRSTLEILNDHFLNNQLPDTAMHYQKLFTEEYSVVPGIGVANGWITFYLRQGNLEAAREAFASLPKRRLQPNQITFTAFYRYFLRVSDFASAEQIKQAMLSAGVSPDTKFYNMQLKMYFDRKMLKEADAVIDEMRQKKVWMDRNTYDVLVAGNASAGRADQMEKWMWERSKEGESAMSQRSYSRLIESLGMNMSPDQCRGIFEEIKAPFNVFTHYSLVMAFLEQRRYDEVAELMRDMQKSPSGLPVLYYLRIAKKSISSRFPFGITFVQQEIEQRGLQKTGDYFEVIIKHMLDKHMYASVDEYLAEMKQLGVMMTEGLVGIILDHLATCNHVREAEKLVQWLAGQQGHAALSPTIYERLHKFIYQYACRHLGGLLFRCEELKDGNVYASDRPYDFRPLKLANVEAMVNTAFPALSNRPFHLTVHVFNDILVNCLKTARFEDFFAVYQEMRRHQIPPNLFTFTYLIKARLWLGQPDMAKSLLWEMRKYQWTPSLFHFGLVHHAFCRLGMTSEAEALLKEMKTAFHVQPNHVFYAALLYAHCRRYEYSAVFRTFEQMESSGLRPDTETCNYVLLSLFDVGEYAEAMQFFSRMCLEGIKRNTYTYSILTDRMMVREDTGGMLEILSDSGEAANTVDIFPFLRILSYHYGKLEYDRLECTVDTMVGLGVRFEHPLLPFILFALQRKTLSPTPATLCSARLLLEKALIDCYRSDDKDTLEEPALWEYKDKLVALYGQDRASIDSLDRFCDNLPAIRRLFHECRLPDRARTMKGEKGLFDGPCIADFFKITRLQAPPLSACGLVLEGR